MRGSTLALLGVIALTTIGVLYLRASSTELVWVFSRDVPAYHSIGQSDLREERVPRASIPDDVVTEREAITGTYTLAALDMGTPVTDELLGPSALGTDVDDYLVVALPAQPAQVLNGRVARGDVVELIFKPQIEDDPPVSIEGVPVLDVRRVDAGYVLTVGLDQGQLVSYRAADWLQWSLIREEALTAP